MVRILTLLSLLASSVCLAQSPPAFMRSWDTQGVSSIAVSPTGFVYGADGAGIHKFDSEGQSLDFFPLDTYGLYPEGLSIDPGNQLHWVGFDEVVGRSIFGCDSTGTFTEWGGLICCAECAECEDCMPVGIPVRLDVRTSRGLYALDARWGTVCGPTVVRGLSGPFRGIAVDPEGSVFVTNGSVNKFGVDGHLVQSWAGSTEGGALNGPNGIAVDNAGRVYVVDSGNNRVQMFTNDGHYLTSWGESGSGPGQFSGPSGIALDAQGSVYVLDAGNARIEKFGAYVAVTPTTWSAIRRSYR